MDQTLYMFFYVIALSMLLISIFYKRDYQLQGLLSGIAFILFGILTVQGFNIDQKIVYDSGNFTTYRLGAPTVDNPDGTMEWMIPVGISLIFMIFSFLNMFVAFTAKAWSRTVKGMKIPEGFKGFK